MLLKFIDSIKPVLQVSKTAWLTKCFKIKVIIIIIIIIIVICNQILA